ncbi:methyltransferase type 11 [Sphingobacterium shayense]|uniref:methyltransferase type 11 n=1 Tax=Sphingobacterium shayense TaxID=626343 RepID=UPI001556B4F3|nr:methyltransferase type 11 [Sphingobacterium shayense]NQD70920.1 methyltransferase type 11 [Sphingobacterium shayense]
MKTVKIFKTNVGCNEDANKIITCLLALNPAYKINFDLEDEENILRIESNQYEIDIEGSIKSVTNLGFVCEKII